MSYQQFALIFLMLALLGSPARTNPRKAAAKERLIQRHEEKQQTLQKQRNPKESAEPTGDKDVLVRYREAFRPSHVLLATESNFFKMRKGNDVVVLLVTKKANCETCAEYHEQFIRASEKVERDKLSPHLETSFGAKLIQFAILDADEEGLEFSYLLGEEDEKEADVLVPSILVFKREFQERFKKSPIAFVLNEHVAEDLPKLAFRLAGPALRLVPDEAALMRLLAHSSSENILVVFWSEAITNHDAVKRIVELERMNVNFAVATFQPPEGTPAYPGPYSPYTAIGYHRTADGGFSTRAIDSMLMTESFESLVTRLRKFVSSLKLLRPGHEYDEVTTLVVDDVPGLGTGMDAQLCEKRKSKAGEKILIRITGLNLVTREIILNLTQADVMVGGRRGDLPEALTQKGLLNLCPTMKRRVVTPPGLGYEKGNEPPGVETEDRLLFDLEMLGWDIVHETLSGEAPPTPQPPPGGPGSPPPPTAPFRGKDEL
jgi:hypothetical protein